MGDTMKIFNNSQPVSPGGIVSAGDDARVCCFCCSIPGHQVAVAGIPEGTMLLAWDEARPILARWRGHWRVQPFQGIAPPFMRAMGNIGNDPFTDVYIDGDIMAFSGGQQVQLVLMGSGQNYRRQVIHTYGEGSGDLSTLVNNALQQQRLELRRGRDGTLYCDNIGSKLISESPTKLKIQHGLNFTLELVRNDPKPKGKASKGKASGAGASAGDSAVPMGTAVSAVQIGTAVCGPMEMERTEGAARDVAGQLPRRV
jgi:hypothetical protein